MKFAKPALLIAAVLLLPACSPQTKVQGKDVSATYSGFTLRSNLPAQTRVPAVISAAEQTMRARGYTIVSSAATEEKGEIIGYPPRYNNFPRIVIDSSRGVSSTIVDMRVEPFGDQETCRSMLDGMLQRLGL